MRLWAALLLALGSAGCALAQDTDLDALSLADKSESVPAPRPADWNLLVEAAVEWADDRQGEDESAGEELGQDAGRVSLDLRYDPVLARGLRAVVADRLDVYQQAPAGTTQINTLKEAYLSWQESPDRLLDLGRINVRNGVAMGYNPTDYFRFDAVRSVVSINPASLRDNRLGSVMLRGQQLWRGGSLTALVSPRLEEKPSGAPFSADLGASNGSNRWLVQLSERIGKDFDPQVLLMGNQHQPVQVGVNLTHLVSSSTVAFLEWSGGRGPTLLQQSSGLSGPTAFLSRMSTGFTYTAPNNLAVTVEYERNDAAPDLAQWAALQHSGAGAFARAVGFIGDSQDLPDRQALFVLALWSDGFIKHLDLSAFTRMDLKDESALSWAEARYHWSHVDLALQWQFASGSSRTLYGAYSPRQLGQLLVDWYLP